jgi:4'-phosphopantetheinyl transferase
MSEALALPRGREVHVWHSRLDDPALMDEATTACLSRGERQRAARFHFERHRRRFLASHAFLREVLARYLGCPAADVELGEASAGKPELAARADGLRFNLSHSGEVALVVVAAGREVGADVEFLSRPRPLESLGPRVLSPAERDQLAAAEPAERQSAFLRAWTRKEAVLKASGTGIDRDLAAVEVGIAAGEHVVALADLQEVVSEWSVSSFDPAPGYFGAVAAQGAGLELLERPG